MYGLKEGEGYYPWMWPMPGNGVIGKRRVRRLDGYEKASGKAVYGRDIYRPGMLYAKYLRSRYAHAKIKRLDTSKAEALPGIRAVLRYDDPNIVWPEFLGQPLVSDTNHWYPGVVGAVVVGESEAAVDEALRLIEIEMEELPVIMDVEDALKPDAPIMRPDQNPKTNRRTRFETVLKHGDVEAGFAQADKIIEWKATTEQDVWAGVEAMCGVAEWKGEYLEVWQHGQNASGMMNALRAYAPVHKIHLYLPYNGAQFGGTTYSGVDRYASQVAVIAARQTGCPVKFLDDESHFADGCCEDARSRYYFKVGFKLDGTITAVKLKAYETWVTEARSLKIREGTRIPNIYISGDFAAFTRPPSYCFKHGSSTVRVVAQVWEHVAGELGMDPTKVAEINDGCDGHDMAYISEHVKKPQGFDPSRDSVKEVNELGKAAMDWDKKWHLPGTKILPNGNYHGMGYISTIGWAHTVGNSSAAIRINSDGTVNILAAQQDGGWCPQTTYCQVAADELGVTYKDVRIRAYDDRGGFASAPGGGSAGMNGTTPSMVRAARKMKQLILEKAVEPSPQRRSLGNLSPQRPALFPNKKPEELDLKGSVVFEKANPGNKKTLAQIAAAWSRDLFVWDVPPAHTGRGGVEKEYCMVRQAHFVEVEVDPDTGGIEIIKQVSVNDGGRVINPDAFNGQQYGGAYMGLGRSSKETVYHDPQTGVALNENLIGYPVNVMNDVASIDCRFVETGLGYAPYGTSGIGESGGAVNHCIMPSAIYNAIGKYVDSEPVTPDKILKALGKA
jgi:xanthine dehydrogenase molybdenum-binding subunit